MPLYHFLLLCILVCRTDLFSFSSWTKLCTMPETCCSCSSICRDQKLYSWVLPWNWEFGCSCFFFVSGTDFKGILYLFTFCIHDRENASSCFSSCLWNDCWGDRFIFLYSDLLFLTQKVCWQLAKIYYFCIKTFRISWTVIPWDPTDFE